MCADISNLDTVSLEIPVEIYMLKRNVMTNNVKFQYVTKGIQDLAHFTGIMADVNILITVNMNIFKQDQHTY